MDGRRGHTELVLLAIVAGGPIHGWAIIEQIRLRTGQKIEIGEGVVYPLLHKLERAGYLGSKWRGVDGRSQRQYTLTRKGRAELDKRRAAWDQLALGMRTLLDGI